MPASRYTIGELVVSRYAHSLLNLAETLHCSVTGASDPLPAADAIFIKLFLEARLADWYPSPPFSLEYDQAVNKLITAVLAEYARDLDHDLEWCHKHGSTPSEYLYNPDTR